MQSSFFLANSSYIYILHTHAYTYTYIYTYIDRSITARFLKTVETLMEDDQILPKSTTADRDAVVGLDVVAAENTSRQDSKQVEFSLDEETLVTRMYNLVGERWSLIAGRIPGRNAEEIEKYWNSKHSTCSEIKKPELTYLN
ncbi:hypothetical protein MIMGU_mgv1a015917mg [Erythranthe guttata]|uniref:Myb-like domain-containing protein n=1 Tax=Erythranthe guttata TaxID=4155 RepID=A0A022QE42_ERYGU|nr:PREDICTED: uncharacterized protein LOC105972042 [Erythranthe guttata]EYU24790.1 hypothetical protein MIMGU_mgv1a015917mg [Erythranthe guttata]|eukprot:XP_012852430.1 PREDICTED: uncharacterized protein LOC105972042 [Erythranthe guttata]